MEELSIKEKAKAYDGLIERLKDLKFAYRFSSLSDTIEEKFPELKESEDDRIRKTLIEHFAGSHSSMYPYKGFTKEQILAWFEKQSEKDEEILILKDQVESLQAALKAKEETWKIRMEKIEKQGEQNPAWSEEDEEALEVAIIALEDMYSEDSPLDCYAGHHMTFDKAANQLKSLKDRVQPQPNQEWSEEDSKNMKECVIAVSMSEGHTLEEKERLEDWLKNHLSQKQYNYNPYKAVVESIAEMCEKYKLPTSNLSDFLDNVKVKCKEAKEFDVMFPQSTWKPSDEQIEALRRMKAAIAGEGEIYKPLNLLYEDLLKLRDE